MKIFKSIFSAGHFPFLLFAVINIALGITLYLLTTYILSVANLHFFAGLLIFIAPLAVLAFSGSRKQMFAALKGRLLINKNDIKNKKTLTIISKVIAWVFICMLLMVTVGGILLKSGIMANLIPDINFMKLHRNLVFIMPFVLLLHTSTMKISSRKK
jgi:hypothetical protein